MDKNERKKTQDLLMKMKGHLEQQFENSVSAHFDEYGNFTKDVRQGGTLKTRTRDEVLQLSSDISVRYLKVVDALGFKPIPEPKN